LAFLIAASATAAHAVTLTPGDIIVAGPEASAGGPGPLLHIDAATGDRTVISGCIDAPDCTQILGTGPPWGAVSQAGVSSDGQILVLDNNGTTLGKVRVFSVDPESGDRTIISGCVSAQSGNPCDSVAGSGLPILSNRAFAVVPSPFPAISSLQNWGVLLLIALLLVVSKRERSLSP
jgi:hypothetical protein